MNLDRRSVLVTGAGRGLGAALATEFARRGARVALVARTQAELQNVVGALCDRGFEAHGIVGDLGDKNAAHRIAATAAELVGPIEILVNNAGTLGTRGLRVLLDTDCEDLERALVVNVLGAFRLTKIIAGAMAVRGGGDVLSVSSDAAIEAYPQWGAYGASKAALEHMMRTFAVELESLGVRFSSVDPGEMHTRMHAEALPDADTSRLRAPHEVAQSIVRKIASHEDLPTRWTVQLPSPVAA